MIIKPIVGQTGWGPAVDQVIDGVNGLPAGYSAAAAHLASNGTRSRLVPAFTKHPNNPIMEVAATPYPTLCWVSVIKAAGALTSPLGDYYMWYSTDHDEGAGGVALAHGPSPVGPWTHHGQVFVDTVQGFQTETPSVIWNEQTGLLHLYYQQLGPGSIATQATLLATSPDGVAWTRVGIVLDHPAAGSFAGSGHTGYFQPFRIGTLWAGYHLLTSGNLPTFALSWSRDGITWTIDPRPLHNAAELFPAPASGYGPARRIEWNSSNVVQVAGRLWWIGMSSDFVSGTTPKDARLGIAPLAPDLRSLLHPPISIFTPGTGENYDFRSINSYVEDGVIYVYYGMNTTTVSALIGGVS